MLLVVFTIEQIDELHERFGHSDSLADYLRGLAALGIVKFTSFVTDGHSEYVGADGQRLASRPHHEVLPIASLSDRNAFLDQLRRHEDGETSYLQLSAGLAEAGVARWVADTGDLTMTYYDTSGVALLVEQLDDGVVSRPDADRRAR